MIFLSPIGFTPLRKISLCYTIALFPAKWKLVVVGREGRKAKVKGKGQAKNLAIDLAFDLAPSRGARQL
jgi:hypothetical protein